MATIADYEYVLSQWHPTKNGDVNPADICAGSNKKFWWLCNKSSDHEWEATSNNRIGGGKDCPCCAGRKIVSSNCLAVTHPDVAAQWHPTKNELLTPYDVGAGSNKKFWWLCNKGSDHEWIATLNNRTGGGKDCPCCAGKKVVLSNCLFTTHYDIAFQWHPTKNGNKTPYDICAGSDKKFWWICNKGSDHEWEAAVSSRTIGNSNCPCCSGHKAVKSNCLATTHPETAAQWHPTKNGNITPFNVVAGGIKLFWWKCMKGHEWKASMNNRTGNTETGCPFCNESKGEKKIAQILSAIGLLFKRQVRFASCKYKNMLPFDFLVKISDSQGVLIEYNGAQHYKPVRWRSSMSDEKMLDAFVGVQKRDKIKKEWATRFKIPLLIIPYWKQKEIEVLVIDFIKNNSYTKK